jgi:hypothetical protein
LQHTPARKRYVPALNCTEIAEFAPRPGPSSLYTINPPSEEYSHNAGSPLDANVRAVNVCGLANEKTKSRLDTPADNNAPGVNHHQLMVVIVDVVVVVVAKPGTSTKVDTKSPAPAPPSTATLNSNRAED